MKITYSNEQDSIDFSRKLADAIEKVYVSVVEQTGIDFCVSILLTNAAGIALLNRDYRNIDSPTDVLSFPAYDIAQPLCCLDEIKDAEWEEGLVFLGDIAISMERAITQAEEYGHSLEREIAFLALHGLLHLMGYDHMKQIDEEKMLDAQRKILEIAGIGR